MTRESGRLKGSECVSLASCSTGVMLFKIQKNVIGLGSDLRFGDWSGEQNTVHQGFVVWDRNIVKYKENMNRQKKKHQQLIS